MNANINEGGKTRRVYNMQVNSFDDGMRMLLAKHHVRKGAEVTLAEARWAPHLQRFVLQERRYQHLENAVPHISSWLYVERGIVEYFNGRAE